MIKINLIENILKIDRFYIEIAIVDSNKSLESKSDHNRRSNLDRHFETTTTIRFGTSNGTSWYTLHKTGEGAQNSIVVAQGLFDHGTALLAW